MTDNPNRLPFNAMSRKDQDRIAGAMARGDYVEHWAKALSGWWRTKYNIPIHKDGIYRIPPTAKPAKDPNRPRPAHKLKLGPDDVVKCTFDPDNGDNWVGSTFLARHHWVQDHIENPRHKGQRPLFIVVSRANGE